MFKVESFGFKVFRNSRDKFPDFQYMLKYIVIAFNFRFLNSYLNSIDTFNHSSSNFGLYFL